MIKNLRMQSHMSQEQLADVSGLSLRTIQRVEAGHRVSYSSLRALAQSFNLNVDELEWELYAMQKSSKEFSEAPLWIRLFLHRGLYSISRKWTLILEKILAGLFLASFCVWLLPLFDDIKLANSRYLMLDEQILIAGFSFLMAAYWLSVITRVSDKFSAWQQVK